MQNNTLPAVPDWDPVIAYQDPWYLSSGYGYSGILSLYEGGNYYNQDVHNFIISQFLRFRVKPPREDLLIWAWEWAFYFVEQYDPYMFFFGMSDVAKTEDNYYYQYAIRDTKDRWYECDPEDIEVYKYWSGFKERFTDIYNTPGLSQHFSHTEEALKDQIAEYISSGADEYPQEHKFFRQYGKQAYDYMHLAVWSCLIWMISPDARWWRHKYHPIFTIAYDYGECLMHSWTMYEPSEFRKFNRPARSCVQCGVTEYWVELTNVDSGGTYYLCEKCLGRKSLPGMDCGTRECDKLSCPNHPGRENASLVASNRRYGKLKTTNGVKHRELPGIMLLNHTAINSNASSIADVVNREFQRLISV